MTRSKVLIYAAAVFSIVTTGCTSQEELESRAQCSAKVLSDRKKDAPKIVDLLPDGTDSVKPRSFSEHTSYEYSSLCLIKDGDGELIFTASGRHIDGGENDPADENPENFPDTYPIRGETARITSDTPGVAGITGSGSASLRTPCTLHGKVRLEQARKGFLAATVIAEDAPDADSTRQRQNAADLALSYLRYAVKWCEGTPKLPDSVKVQG